MSARARRRATDWVLNGTTVAFTALVLFPFYWLLVSSVETPDQLFRVPAVLVPVAPTLDNFERLLQSSFPHWFQNSLVVASATTLLALTLAALAAYSFSRFPFAASRGLSTMFLFVQLFPVAVVVIPLFILWTNLKLTNTYWSLIITYLVFGLPISTWLLIGFFNAVPVELEEAAMIDGASRLGALWRVTLPLCVPGLAATAIYIFLLSWNEFFFALTFMNSTDMRTIPGRSQLVFRGTLRRLGPGYGWISRRVTTRGHPVRVVVALFCPGFDVRRGQRLTAKPEGWKTRNGC